MKKLKTAAKKLLQLLHTPADAQYAYRVRDSPPTSHPKKLHPIGLHALAEIKGKMCGAACPLCVQVWVRCLGCGGMIGGVGLKELPSVSVSKLSLLLKPQFAAGAGSPQI